MAISIRFAFHYILKNIDNMRCFRDSYIIGSITGIYFLTPYSSNIEAK